MTTAFRELPGRRVLQCTTSRRRTSSRTTEPEIFRIAALGRCRPRGRSPASADLALGDSDYNRRELETLGFRSTGVFPIALNLERITKAPPHPALSKILDDGLTNFLFVGRMVPNKRIEDIIFLAELYKRNIDSHYRFIFVGRTDGIPNYYAALRALIVRLEMLPERFLFTGQVDDWELAAYLPQRQRLHVAQRARGLLRARARSDGARACRCSPATAPPSARRSAAPASRGRRKIWSLRPSCCGQLAFDRAAARRSSAAPMPAPRGLQRGRGCIARLAEIVGTPESGIRDTRVHRSTLRHRNSWRRLEYLCRLDGRAARREARRRGAHHVRTRLRHVEERVSRGAGSNPRRHGPRASRSPRRARSTASTSSPTGSSTTRTRTTRRWSGSGGRGRGRRR